jgi:hypothetical protein
VRQQGLAPLRLKADDIRLAEVVTAVATYLAEREVMLPLPVESLRDGRKIEF